MSPYELLLSFIRELGYEGEIKRNFVRPGVFRLADKRTPHFVVLHSRDWPGPMITAEEDPDLYEWCVLSVAYESGRPWCLAYIINYPDSWDEGDSFPCYLDDPGCLAELTAFLDHWYFRYFHRD